MRTLVITRVVEIIFHFYFYLLKLLHETQNYIFTHAFTYYNSMLTTIARKFEFEIKKKVLKSFGGFFIINKIS